MRCMSRCARRSERGIQVTFLVGLNKFRQRMDSDADDSKGERRKRSKTK